MRGENLAGRGGVNLAVMVIFAAVWSGRSARPQAIADGVQFAFEVLPYLGSNGVFVFTGVPGKDQDVDLDTGLIMKNLVLKNQVVLGTVNAGLDAFQAAIHDLAAFYGRWPAAVRALITGRYPIEGFHDLLFGPSHGIKNVIALS